MPTQPTSPAQRRQRSPDASLREDIVCEALAIVEADGLEKLSMREVARRLGVSHQAPYKHFASRDHILAEMVGRAFQAFADYLDAGPTSGVAHEDMGRMGAAYLSYANEYPLNYRLMFGTPLPDPSQHPAMMEKARHAFSMLQKAASDMHAQAGRDVPADAVAQDALYVWATLHGLAAILHGDTVQTLGLSPAVLMEAPQETLARIGGAFGLYPDQRFPNDGRAAAPS